MLVLPIDSTDKNFDVDMDLEGSLFRFRCFYNNRAAAWFCDVIDGATLEPIFTGQRLTTGRMLMQNYVGQDKWPGAVYVLDTTGTQADPAKENLGIDVLLIYLSADEFAAIAALPDGATQEQFVEALA